MSKKIYTSTLMVPVMEDISSTKSFFDILNFIFTFVIHVPTFEWSFYRYDTDANHIRNSEYAPFFTDHSRLARAR